MLTLDLQGDVCEVTYNTSPDAGHALVRVSVYKNGSKLNSYETGASPGAVAAALRADGWAKHSCREAGQGWRTDVFVR